MTEQRDTGREPRGMLASARVLALGLAVVVGTGAALAYWMCRAEDARSRSDLLTENSMRRPLPWKILS